MLDIQGKQGVTSRAIRIATLIAIVLLPTGSTADDFVRIDWRDLTVPVEPNDDPLFGLDYEQRRRVETVLRVARQRKSGAVVAEQDLSLEGQAKKWLRERGLDPQGLVLKDRALIQRIALQRTSIRTEWAGMNVRIPGYVIPLEFSGTDVTEFLLVPYYGACIHTPPPPANQIIDVTLEHGIALDGLFTAVWVNGRLGIQQNKRTVQLSDGMTGFETGYSLDAHSVQLYKK